jgi:hypothetical protein
MLKYKLTGLLILINFLSYAQNKNNNWKDVQIYEFQEARVPDSLSICGGEWFIKGKANQLNELDNEELDRIKKKVAEYGCDIVFVDTKKVYASRDGQLYILGLKRKK